MGLEEAGWAVGGSEVEAADWTEAGSGAAGLVAGSVEEDLVAADSEVEGSEAAGSEVGSVEEDLEAEGLEVDWAAAEM